MRLRDRYGAYGTSTETTTSWQQRGICWGHEDPDLWFPSVADFKGYRDAGHAAYSDARVICARCPVWRQCREYALEAGEEDGMWGGLTPRERRAIRQSRAA
ncbi:WhiB family transcriptional regulator [Spongiactinospora rosea]|uniref:Transcriptional regulator WhiB n=1 Tax=Spongiactinospora rosea TaxID=2248750 RepID=A0A366M5R5_9ACTN|nr:WhiB family transcriptional regulator [Spongiactinospora rosea]RBQ21545.1 WhiB family transcriptional regulator [Spongiactinospora rosea]